MQKTIQPRKQRKRLYKSHDLKHLRQKMVSAHLGSNYLHNKENKFWYLPRSIPIRKGDTVKIERGSSKGLTGKVVLVNLKRGKIQVEAATISKADGKQKPKWLDASKVSIIKFEKSDKRRNEKMKQLLEEEGE